MSPSSPEDDDCIVAVKFLGPQLSLCRPARKDSSEWLNIRIEDSAFFSSRVMYSKRHEMFSLLASGGTHTRSWDLEKHISHYLHFPLYPEFGPGCFQVVEVNTWWSQDPQEKLLLL